MRRHEHAFLVDEQTGAYSTVEIGKTTTLPAGEQATVENVGTLTAAVLDFGIPTGPRGPQGLKGETGDHPQLRFDEDENNLVWKLSSSEQWTQLLDLNQLQGEIIEETREEFQGYVSSASASAAAAGTAKTAAETAKAAAETAKTAAETAKKDAVDARNEAVPAATAAVNARNESVNARNEAVPAATAAVNARNEAVPAAASAVAARDEAVPAAASAVAARDEAVPAAASAVAARDEAAASAQAAGVAAAEAVQVETDRAVAAEDALSAKIDNGESTSTGNVLNNTNYIKTIDRYWGNDGWTSGSSYVLDRATADDGIDYTYDRIRVVGRTSGNSVTVRFLRSLGNIGDKTLDYSAYKKSFTVQINAEQTVDIPPDAKYVVLTRTTSSGATTYRPTGIYLISETLGAKLAYDEVARLKAIVDDHEKRIAALEDAMAAVAMEVYE